MAVRDEIEDTVKLVFQPAEEGVRGAKAMVSAGFDAIIIGAAAHAGGRPHDGRNALLAAATAVLNLHSIPRHKDGATRINVGKLVAGTGRNVVCPSAHLAVETRGSSGELNEYMHGSAMRVLESAASMHGCTLSVRAMGGARSASSDAEMAERVRKLARGHEGISLRQPDAGGESEDFTYMMQRVQQRGGQATSIGIGADLGGWGHHTAEFDFDERTLGLAIRLLSEVTMDLVRVRTLARRTPGPSDRQANRRDYES